MYLTQFLHRTTQQDPERIFSVDGDRVTDYAQTVDLVARVAGGLQSAGVCPSDRVAILSLNSDRYLQALLAIAWADAVVVPVNIRWSPGEIAYSLVDAEVKVLLIDDMFTPMLEAIRAKAPGLATIIHLGDGRGPDGATRFAHLVAESDPVADAHRCGDALAGIFYTGGTTGAAKGVMLSHRNLLVSALGSCALGLVSPCGIVLHSAPLFHLAGLAMWLASAEMGGTNITVPIFEPTAVMGAIQQHEVTDILLVPTMIQLLVDHPDLESFDLTTLRKLLYGASPISEALLSRARKAMPGTSFAQGYGMTELSPMATALVDADHDDATRRRSAGRAMPHSLVKVVDPVGMEVPRGTVGEVVVSGDNVMLGYWKKPSETASAIRDGWMHTGDGAYMDEQGYVYIVDRIKDMIITGGENVYSAEVENIVALHPAVAQCAVIGLPDDNWGERVHAVIQLVPGAALTFAELHAHCKAHIAGYKCPRSMESVAEFPTSGAGKILKRVLRLERR